jgi:pyruvate dehydrogenase E2 component (dihydrolipoamide acetyltransferase)
VTVIELLVKPGDSVKAEQSLITVESDKASMEIPFQSRRRRASELRVALGDKVAQGSVVLVLEAADAQPDTAPAAAAPAPAPAAPVPSAPVAPTPAAAPAGAAAPVEVRVPDIGDFKDVTVIEVLVQPGANIKLEQSLVTVESDKASMEIPSSVAGVLQEIRSRWATRSTSGICWPWCWQRRRQPQRPCPRRRLLPRPRRLRRSHAVVAEAAALAPASRSRSGAGAQPGRRAERQPAACVPVRAPHSRGCWVCRWRRSAGPGRRAASPNSTCRIHALRDVRCRADPRRGGCSVQGGPGRAGRRRWRTGPAALAQGGLREVRPGRAPGPPRIKKISAANLHRNWVLIPHVTNHDDADITDLEAFRVLTNKENEKSGVKVTMLAFLIKACVAALRRFPEFNSSLDGDQLVLQALLPHRVRGGHAQGPDGAGHQGRRHQGRAADLAGDGATWRRRPATAS